MKRDELDLIDFALIWHPYGGPTSEDLLVVFGLTPHQFRVRVKAILEARGTSTDRPLRQHARANLRSYLCAVEAT
ncbi:hypothetical protein [Nocardia salmonicida]|uniref:hypothetical protein n=1 Tax=Nocardia salmonicida TaxID=53431 RepID=UPI0037ADFF19